MIVSPLNFGIKSPIKVHFSCAVEQRMQCKHQQTRQNTTITHAKIAMFGASDVMIKHQGTSIFEHAVMWLYLHGELAEAQKEQVKHVLVPNEEERARKRTRATTRDAWVRAEECDQKLRSA